MLLCDLAGEMAMAPPKPLTAPPPTSNLSVRLLPEIVVVAAPLETVAAEQP